MSRSHPSALGLATYGAVVGAAAGATSWIFLEGLDRVTRFRLEHGDLVYLLPLAGGVLGLFHQRVAGRAAFGSRLVMTEIKSPTAAGVPVLMAPVVLVGTWITHLVGGSVGREGTALAMSGSLADSGARRVGLDDRSRQALMTAALAAGFGAVFGLPWAGLVFAFEAPRVRPRPAFLAPAIVAALVGDTVARALGADHADRIALDVDWSVEAVGALVVAGLAFGLTSRAFVWLTRLIRDVQVARVPRPAVRAALGGVGMLALLLVAGRAYAGLSLPLSERALAGEDLRLTVFALKLMATAWCLGSGLPGGEVTPLFVIGSTLGAGLGGPLGTDRSLLATVGFVAVFAAAARVPLAGIVMAGELFGSGAILPAALTVGTARLVASRHGIYHHEP